MACEGGGGIQEKGWRGGASLPREGERLPPSLARRQIQQRGTGGMASPVFADAVYVEMFTIRYMKRWERSKARAVAVDAFRKRMRNMNR